MTTKHLDIGCNSNPKNPFACDELYGVDITKQEVSDFIYEKWKSVLIVLRKQLVMIFKNTQLVKNFPMGQILGKSSI